MGLQWRQPAPEVIYMLRSSLCLDDRAQWFAVQVRAGRERASADQLRVRGYEIFLPTLREARVWSDRVKQVERALFEGYLFSRMSDDVIGRIVTTPGIIRIVGDGRRPVPVPVEEVETLQRILASRLSVAPWPFLEAGQRVHVEAGPLKGTEGIVESVKDGDRFVASVTILQRSVAVELNRAWVVVTAPRREPAAHGGASWTSQARQR